MVKFFESVDPAGRAGLLSVLDRAATATRHIEECWPYNPTLLDAWDGLLGVALAEHLRGAGGPNPYGGGGLSAGAIPPGGWSGADRSYLWWTGQCYEVPPELDGQALLAWVQAHTPFAGSSLDEWGGQVSVTVLCDACEYLDPDTRATALRPAVTVHGQDLVGLSLCTEHWRGVTWPRNGTDALRFRQPTQKGKR